MCCRKWAHFWEPFFCVVIRFPFCLKLVLVVASLHHYCFSSCHYYFPSHWCCFSFHYCCSFSIVVIVSFCITIATCFQYLFFHIFVMRPFTLLLLCPPFLLFKLVFSHPPFLPLHFAGLKSGAFHFVTINNIFGWGFLSIHLFFLSFFFVCIFKFLSVLLWFYLVSCLIVCNIFLCKFFMRHFVHYNFFCTSFL